MAASVTTRRGGSRTARLENTIMSTLPDNESVYDEQISPLMDQIIAICKQHNMPMLATFEYAADMACTTYIPFPGQSRELHVALDIIRNGVPAQIMALTLVGGAA